MATWTHIRFGGGAFGKTAALAFVVLLLRSPVVLAARNGIPGPPPPPQPPCISTATLFQTSEATIDLRCVVRNVGVTPHTVTAEFRDDTNLLQGGNTELLLPGESLTAGEPVASNLRACVVTTAEGTTDALGDLAVVLQAGPLETEGKIFQQCAPAKPLP